MSVLLLYAVVQMAVTEEMSVIYFVNYLTLMCATLKVLIALKSAMIAYHFYPLPYSANFIT